MKTEIVSIMAVCFCAISFCAPSANAVIVDFYNDATIQNGDIYDIVKVYDSPPANTTLNVLGGSAHQIQGHDFSKLNITGGDILALFSFDSSQVNVSKGDIYGFYTYNSSCVNISGGRTHVISTLDSSTIDILDDANVELVKAMGYSVLNIKSGRIGSLNAMQHSVINLYGGIINRGLGARGGEGTINVFGYDLIKTNTGGLYGYGEVHGFYPDGTSFSINLAENTYSQINLVPEPATIILLFFGAAILRRKNCNPHHLA